MNEMQELPEPQTPPRRRRSDAVYRAAQSHSRRVALMKGALPVLAVGGLLWLAVDFVSGPEVPEGLDVDIGSTVIEDGNLVMANPEVTGRTSDDRPYRVIAQRAIQSVSDANAIAMEGINAEFELSGGEKARILAPQGSYDRAANHLVLQGQSVFSTDRGTQVEFDGAEIDVEQGNFTTPQPVRIVRDGTTITAGSMRISDNGDSIVLEPNVRLIIPPGALPRSPRAATQELSNDQ